MKTEKYPFDFDSLQKGDVIPVEMLEEITKMSRSHKDFNLKILGLREQIEHELEGRGRPVNVKCDHGSLRILTDEEAVPYTAQLFRQHRRALGRAHLRACIIDPRGLNSEVAKRLESQLLNQAAKLAAMKRARPKAIESTGGGQAKIE
jgi:hypothetical protein